MQGEILPVAAAAYVVGILMAAATAAHELSAKPQPVAGHSLPCVLLWMLCEAVFWGPIAVASGWQALRRWVAS